MSVDCDIDTSILESLDFIVADPCSAWISPDSDVKLLFGGERPDGWKSCHQPAAYYYDTPKHECGRPRILVLICDSHAECVRTFINEGKRNYCMRCQKSVEVHLEPIGGARVY